MSGTLRDLVNLPSQSPSHVRVRSVTLRRRWRASGRARGPLPSGHSCARDCAPLEACLQTSNVWRRRTAAKSHLRRLVGSVAVSHNSSPNSSIGCKVVSRELRFHFLKPFLSGHVQYPGDPQCGRRELHAPRRAHVMVVSVCEKVGWWFG